ncbi:tRNA (cytosine(72)-C(5))-methyltransferase NSUN6 [Microplitis demolitor]|uniref:tRNA (cytosine(72)-C(5))-methyltransferase NSUN6 n=1 Tax=Microplitis demolitor TaxID=69319 RepID=UPI00235B5E08|nr:tRNA (cytosine(72)-C(5))-methyltransferase NSUN6 [Microplitis demolitor]
MYRNCFRDEIKEELFEDFKRIRKNNFDAEIKLNELITWLRTTPKVTTIRINTLTSSAEKTIKSLMKKKKLSITQYPKLPELLSVTKDQDLVQTGIINGLKEAVVDASCGAAVLRGAHVFAPGVMGLVYANLDEQVNVFADVTGHCKKGLSKIYDCPSKIFIGCGLLKQTRGEIFRDNSSGLAIYLKKTTSGLPQLSNDDLEDGLLQNLPSIICSRILDPRPGDLVLDMCAAPGNKTTHISALMNNVAGLIAIDKIQSKVDKLRANCRASGSNVKIFCFNSINAVDDAADKTRDFCKIEPPFAPETFDKILLDGPCSALGQRPQLFNKITVKQLRSFVALQRKLFSTAVELLKPGGTLVYSTCTVTVAENEGIVAWALNNFPSLKLSSARKIYESFDLEGFPGSTGYDVDNLSSEESSYLLRFGPESDTIGFFIALFIKNQEV